MLVGVPNLRAFRLTQSRKLRQAKDQHNASQEAFSRRNTDFPWTAYRESLFWRRWVLAVPDG